MTDSLIERAKTALEEHNRWFDSAGGFLGGNGELTPLEVIAPSLARLVVAAGELADRVEEYSKMQCGIDEMDRALSRFRAVAKEAPQ